MGLVRPKERDFPAESNKVLATDWSTLDADRPIKPLLTSSIRFFMSSLALLGDLGVAADQCSRFGFFADADVCKWLKLYDRFKPLPFRGVDSIEAGE
jgi:hypothetical protein